MWFEESCNLESWNACGIPIRRALDAWWSLRWRCLQISLTGLHLRIIEQFVKYRKHVQASSDSSPGANSKRQQIQVVKFSDWCLGLLQNDSLLGIPDWDQEVADEVLFASIWSSILSQLSCMWKVEIRTTSNLLVANKIQHVQRNQDVFLIPRSYRPLYPEAFFSTQYHCQESNPFDMKVW